MRNAGGNTWEINNIYEAGSKNMSKKSLWPQKAELWGTSSCTAPGGGAGARGQRGCCSQGPILPTLGLEHGVGMVAHEKLLHCKRGLSLGQISLSWCYLALCCKNNPLQGPHAAKPAHAGGPAVQKFPSPGTQRYENASPWGPRAAKASLSPGAQH